MITRRGFLKRASVALVALCVGIKPARAQTKFTGGEVVPAEYRDALITGKSFTGKSFDRTIISMPKLDNAGIDTKKLRSIFTGGDCDAIIAGKLIQMLEPADFDSLAQYSRCVTAIAEEFGL